MGDTKENPPTNCIVWNDSHLRKSRGGTVAERLACLPPTKANQVTRFNPLSGHYWSFASWCQTSDLGGATQVAPPNGYMCSVWACHTVTRHLSNGSRRSTIRYSVPHLKVAPHRHPSGNYLSAVCHTPPENDRFAVEFDAEAFIHKVQQPPTIWDAIASYYCNREKKKKAWDEFRRLSTVRSIEPMRGDIRCGWSSTCNEEGEGNGSTPRIPIDQRYRPDMTLTCEIPDEPAGNRAQITLVGGECASYSTTTDP
ncbi:hypothetical protein PR048_005677 [Dryococelus australis]|uniref:Uncharacterized protein n=1 Tax=Dryococelus australis TaxID=614101 RepID=A0ABQ9I9X7_9NEOP|nr:hypothetical protein PR048_005677 [Dryococelus australis]